ncbi:hypothetical protein PRK78_005112 [Emydomyces testavorans]|uniref:Uncharacterized protein n=1 Tax=Emydomyces testavorans TaxID=2070801 RepID=A0AAF0DK16_9EURO|nr:hypothetical protein PRK78_005112 [Emydomyces testavorans]
MNNISEKHPGLYKRPFFYLPSRAASPAASPSSPNALYRTIFKNRPLSMSNVPRFSMRFDSAEISRIFDFGRATRTHTASLGSSGSDLLQSSTGHVANESSEVFHDDLCCAEGSAQSIMSFRGGTAWRQLDTDRAQLCLDLFWSSQKENPFRPDIMPILELAPLSNFRRLRVLKLTGMLQSYQVYIWQAVWLNPALEDLHLEMALEPCIRQTFRASWPKIKGNWFPRTAAASAESTKTELTFSYNSGKNGQGELQRRVGFGEYLDKHAIATAREAAEALGPIPEKLPIVKLTLMGFVVDSDPFFLWFNPHRLRNIDFKDHCVDAGFALPASMSEQVVVSWPEEDHIKEAMSVRSVRPEEIKCIDLGSTKKSAANNHSGNKGGVQSKGRAFADDPCEGAASNPSRSPGKLRKRNGNQGRDSPAHNTQAFSSGETSRGIAGWLNLGGRQFLRKKN